MWPPTHPVGDHRTDDHQLGTRPAECGRPRTEPMITPARPWNPPPTKRAPAPHGRTRRRGRTVPDSGRPGPRTCHPPPRPEVDLNANIRCPPCAGSNRTTAGRVAPSSNGPAGNGRASASGTAAHVTTGSGSSAHPAPSPKGGGRGERADCAGGQRSVRDGLAVRVGDGAPTRLFMVMSGVAGEVEPHEVDLTMQRVRSTRAERAGAASRPVTPGRRRCPTPGGAAGRARPRGAPPSGDRRLGAGPAGCGRPRTKSVITPVLARREW